MAGGRRRVWDVSRIPRRRIRSCLAAAFHFPYGLYGLGLCIGALALLILMVMRMGYSEGGEYDRRRNLVYSNKGTYGTAGFMSRKELTEVLDLVRIFASIPVRFSESWIIRSFVFLQRHDLTGILRFIGASGSKKTRAFCVNMILQCAARKSSLVICDPKSELYEKTSEYLRDQGYTVRVFNLVTPSASDSWNCLAEVGGQELMAQLFCDVIIKNTGGEERDHFWDSAEMNLLKALVLYVSTSYPKKKQNIGEVYQLIAASSEQELNALLVFFRLRILPKRHTAFSSRRQRVCAVALSSGSAPDCRFFKTGIFATSHPTTRSIWNSRESSHARITALPAIRTAPLISSPRCFFPSCLSAWFAMRTNNVPAGSFRFLFMYLVKSCVPVE